MSEAFNIYMCGVGGQGIGLLAELLARAAGHAGWRLRGCDTHGLAQRGGMVSSHLRLGTAWSPLIAAGQADLVLALERSEALRGARTMLRAGGSLVWYDTTWQALDVRTGANQPVVEADVLAAVAAVGGRAVRVFRPDLPDPRMQNVALVAELLRQGLLPRVGTAEVVAAMRDLMGDAVLQANLPLLGAASAMAARP